MSTPVVGAVSWWAATTWLAVAATFIAAFSLGFGLVIWMYCSEILSLRLRVRRTRIGTVLQVIAMELHVRRGGYTMACVHNPFDRMPLKTHKCTWTWCLSCCPFIPLYMTAPHKDIANTQTWPALSSTGLFAVSYLHSFPNPKFPRSTYGNQPDLLNLY
jgi:hypothetical protein